MSHQEKINYMRLASNLCRFGFDYQHIDLLVSLYEALQDKQGELNVRDISGIEADCKQRADTKHKQELLDKVSTEV